MLSERYLHRLSAEPFELVIFEPFVDEPAGDQLGREGIQCGKSGVGVEYLRDFSLRPLTKRAAVKRKSSIHRPVALESEQGLAPSNDANTTARTVCLL